jgi:transcription elongation factor GreB
LNLQDYEMRKGFTRKPQGDEPATQGKSYITRSGLQRLKDEHRFLLTRDRLDGRIRFLTKRIEAAEVVDPEAPRAGQLETRAFFGATVRYANAAGAESISTASVGCHLWGAR